MRLFFRRFLLSGIWLYCLLVFAQSCQELVQQAARVDYWGQIWKGVFPVYALLGGAVLVVAAIWLVAINIPAGQRITSRVQELRDRAGVILPWLAVLVVIIAAVALLKNPWPWIFRWPYTRQFVVLYAAFLSIFLAYPWLVQRITPVWRRLEGVDLRVERVFVSLGVSFGLVYFLLIPPFMAPDEFVHVYRAWAVSEGVLFVDHSTIPASFTPFFDVFLPVPYHFDHKVDTSGWAALLHQPLRADQRIEMTYSTAAVYPPIAYFPQAAGVTLGRLINAPPLLIYYFGRLANFLVWMLLGWAAIRITPVYKWVFLLLLFLPMSFYMALSLSPDAVTNGSAFLFAAVVLRLAFGETQFLQRKELYWLLGAALLLAVTKVPYFILTLAFFIIPWQKFGSKRKYLLITVAYFAVILFVVALLNLAAFSSLASIGQARKLPSMHERLAEILADPGHFLWIIYNSFQMLYVMLYRTYLGFLGWLDTPLPQFAYTIMALALIVTALVDGAPGISVNIRTRVFFLALSLGIMVMIMSLIYLTFSPANLNFVYGLQGRYFIPIGPFIFLSLYNRKLANLGKGLHWLSLLYLVWVFLQVAWQLAVRFYKF